MAITYKVKYSQFDVEEGRSYDAGYYADNDYGDGTIGTTGMALGRLVAFKSDGNTGAEGYAGKTVTTLQYADASDAKKAVGFIWRASWTKKDLSPIDKITTKDDNYYPVGYSTTLLERESEPLVMIKRGVVVVQDTTRNYHFNTVKKALTGTIEVAGGDLDTVVGTGTAFTTELRVGDLISVGGVIKEVKKITDATHLDVTVAFAGAVAALTAIYVESDLGRPIYLGENGLYTIATPASGSFMQIVGYVVNGNNILVNLELDIKGKTA